MPVFASYLKYIYLASLLVLGVGFLVAMRRGGSDAGVAFNHARRAAGLFLAVAWVFFALAMIPGEARIMRQDLHLMRGFTPAGRLSMQDSSRVGTRRDYYEFMQFVRKKTPEGARILLVAKAVHPGYRARYYLYPRRLWWYKSPGSVDLPGEVRRAKISHVVVLGYPDVEVPGMRRLATYSPDEFILRRGDER